jgi:hypothetical protein
VGGATVKYFFSTNNNALVEFQNADNNAGTCVIVRKGTDALAYVGLATVAIKAVAFERDVLSWFAVLTFNVTVGNADPTLSTLARNISRTLTTTTRRSPTL